ncbi:MAG: AsmA-like C-terminal region-containing protein [Bacteroidales bacterium]
MEKVEKSKNRTRKIILKTSAWTLGVLLFLTSILFLLAFLMEDKIAEYAISKLNENLNTKVTYDKLKFSFLKNFPDASLEFQNVNIKGTNQDEEDDLVQVKSFTIRFDIWDIVSKKYAVRKIDMGDGKINFKHFADGSNNYSIFKNDSVEDTKGLDFQIRSLNFKNIDLSFQNYKSNDEYHFLAHKARAKGSFSDEVYDMSLKGKFDVINIMHDSLTYIKNKTASANFNFKINNKTNQYLLQNGSLELNNIPLKIDGDFKLDEKLQTFQYQITGNNLKLHDFINELPENYQNLFKEIETKGDFSFKMDISADFNKTKDINISLSGSMRNGKITKKSSELDLKNLNFDLTYNNGDKCSLASSALQLKNFSLEHKLGKLQGNISIFDLEKPNIIAKTKGVIDLKDLSEFIANESIKSMEGSLKIESSIDIKLNSFNEISAKDFVSSRSSGNLWIKNGEILFANSAQQLSNINGNMEFSNANLLVNNIVFNNGLSDFSCSGELLDIFPYLFINEEVLKANLKIKSQNIDFDNLLSDNENDKNESKKLVLPQKASVNIDFECNRMKFEKFQGRNLFAKVNFINGRLDVEDLKIESLGGKIWAKGKVSPTNENTFFINLNSKFEKLNGKQTFYCFNNFGQNDDGLTHNKIDGNLCANLEIISEWNSDLTPVLDRLVLIADIEINNGQINNYTTLEALSKFTKIENLSNIKFSKLTNNISIKDGIIDIPKMEINSNAANLLVSGTHDFDNNIDYQIEIKLSEVLGQKTKQANKNNSDFIIEDDGLGNPSLYIRVSGNTNKPKFTYNTKAAKQKVSEQIKENKREIRDAVLKDFGLKKDSTKTEEIKQQKLKKQKEKENVKKQESGEFIIEWDD